MHLSEEPFVIILSFSFFWLALSAVSVCLFICFCSPVLKGDESILCFSVWEKFQQQTFYGPPSSWELRGAQLFLLRGRRGEARQVETQARSMFGCWCRWRRFEKINGFVLYRLAAVRSHFNITFPPKYSFHYSMYAMTVHIWIHAEKAWIIPPPTELDKRKEDRSWENVQRERGKRVMELIYKQNDNQLQSKQRETLRERNAGRQLEREDWEVRLRLERDWGLLGGCGSP